MTEPVIVIHGVNNRCRKEFESKVERLNMLVSDEYQFLPVYWGHLGAKVDKDNLSASFPAVDHFQSKSFEASGHEFTDVDRQRAILYGFRSQMLRDDTNHNVDSVASTSILDEEAVRTAIQEELPSTSNLATLSNIELLKVVGHAIAEVAEHSIIDPSSPNALSVEVQSMDIHSLKNIVKAALRAADEIIGASIGETLGSASGLIRKAIAPEVARFLGDTIVYTRDPNPIRKEIWNALTYWKEEDQSGVGYGVEGRPVNVIAHSLGGVIAFDMATQCNERERLWINNFVTFGSQAALLHTIDRRESLQKFTRGHPVRLPKTIDTWTNLWEPMDAIAFLAGAVFELHDGRRPHDIYAGSNWSEMSKANFWTHSLYWESNELSEVLTDLFGKP